MRLKARTLEATNPSSTCIAATRRGNKFYRLNRRIFLKILLQQHFAQDLLIKFCLDDEICCCDLSPRVLRPYIYMLMAIPSTSIFGFIVFCIVLITND